MPELTLWTSPDDESALLINADDSIVEDDHCCCSEAADCCCGGDLTAAAVLNVSYDGYTYQLTRDPTNVCAFVLNYDVLNQLPIIAELPSAYAELSPGEEDTCLLTVEVNDVIMGEEDDGYGWAGVVEVTPGGECCSISTTVSVAHLPEVVGAEDVTAAVDCDPAGEYTQELLEAGVDVDISMDDEYDTREAGVDVDISMDDEYDTFEAGVDVDIAMDDEYDTFEAGVDVDIAAEDDYELFEAGLKFGVELTML